MQLTDVDKQIRDEFRRIPSYSAVERNIGIPRQRVERRIMKMRIAGIELPPLASHAQKHRATYQANRKLRKEGI